MLRYQVLDPVPNGGTATVAIKIRNRAGKVVATLRLGAKPVNKATAFSKSPAPARGQQRADRAVRPRRPA